MNYGQGAVSGVTGVALLPNTGNNTMLFILAVSLITIGVAVMTTSLLIARKSR
jgi:hypothetical protein